jgi:hypothetical protein
MPNGGWIHASVASGAVLLLTVGVLAPVPQTIVAASARSRGATPEFKSLTAAAGYLADVNAVAVVLLTLLVVAVLISRPIRVRPSEPVAYSARRHSASPGARCSELVGVSAWSP